MHQWVEVLQVFRLADPFRHGEGKFTQSIRLLFIGYVGIDSYNPDYFVLLPHYGRPGDNHLHRGAVFPVADCLARGHLFAGQNEFGQSFGFR